MTGRCAARLPFDVLVAYWAREDADLDRVEEHVFACDECARRLAGVARLAEGIARVSSRRGGVDMIVTGPIADRLEADGLRIRRYRVAPGGTVACTVAPDDDFVLTVLDVDLRGVESVDLVKSTAERGEFGRITGIPVDPASGQVAYVLSGDTLRAFPKTVGTIELLRAGPGEPRRLGLYTFDHTPWPGAGG